jgi:hypothetical protein
MQIHCDTSCIGEKKNPTSFPVGFLSRLESVFVVECVIELFFVFFGDGNLVEIADLIE